MSQVSTSKSSLLHGIVGHDDQIASMKNAIFEKRLTQTWIFSGPSGVGKKRVALGLAQLQLCEKSLELRPCGSCGACLRIAGLKSENVLLVDASDSAGGGGSGSTPSGAGQIKVDQARRVLDFLSLKSLGRARVVIIDQAHQMNLQAANALLKILEEPPVETYFFLISSQMGALPATVRSRAQTLRFRSLQLEELKRITSQNEESVGRGSSLHSEASSQKDSAEIDWLLQFAQGSAEMAFQLLENEAKMRNVRHQALDVLYRGFAGASAVGTDELKKLSEDKETTLLVVGFWFRIFRDARITDQSLWLNSDWSMLVAATAKISEEQRLALEDRLLLMEADVRGNIDRSLLFETFWHAWAKAAVSSLSPMKQETPEV